MFEPLSHARREFLARTVMDMLKYVVAAALATGFFVVFGVRFQVGAAVVFAIFFLLAWALYPPKGEKGEK